MKGILTSDIESYSQIRACPVSGASSARRPRGCAFAFALQDAHPISNGLQIEGPQLTKRGALTDILAPSLPSKDTTCHLKDVDCLNPTDEEVLVAALGAPARTVLVRAELVGPHTGWRDGYLSVEHGFCPPDPTASPAALQHSPGKVWSDLCYRLAEVVRCGKAREAIVSLPDVDPNSIPDDALWAAVLCLGILAHTYRYEEKYGGHEGINLGGCQKLLVDDNNQEDPETKGLPRNISAPFKILSGRLGRPLPNMTLFDLALNNYVVCDPTSEDPYAERSENMKLRWSAFKDRAEEIFLLCFTEFHGCTKPVVDIMARCQEHVMMRDNEGLLFQLIRLKMIIDNLNVVFNKINLNPHSDQFASAIEWGQKYAKWGYPLSSRVPTNSGMHMPFFHVMDAFLGRTDFSSFLGRDSLHLRKWVPFNVRAFLVALERYYRVPDYVLNSGDPRLIGVLKGIVQSYTGERGFMGVHRYKAFGFLEIAAKTGRSETNSGSGATSIGYRPWEEVHRSLSASMKERLAPYHSLTPEPHEIRGTFEECHFAAHIISTESIDNDSARKTGKVTLDIRNTGICFAPGDRLMILPSNNWIDVEKIAQALNIVHLLEEPVAVDGDWKRYLDHLSKVHLATEKNHLVIKDILTKGKLFPISKEFVSTIYSILGDLSPTVKNLLSSDAWPLQASLGDLLLIVSKEVPEHIWRQIFPLNDLQWLPSLISVETPRSYNISNFSPSALADVIELTVTRSRHKVCPDLSLNYANGIRSGVCSEFLNPYPLVQRDIDEVIIGISRPFHFRLPEHPSVPIIMFAQGSGIAPFRSFWEARVHERAQGRNILFLAVHSREKFLYEAEIRQEVERGFLEAHIAFSRDNRGLVYNSDTKQLSEKQMEPRYIDAAIIDAEMDLCNLIKSPDQGGSGAYIYVCGSMSFYDTVSSGLSKILSTQRRGERILQRAFSEGRIMLDVSVPPQPAPRKDSFITLSQLGRHTGYGGTDQKVWIGVHGSVYDVTDFVPLHPGGRYIIASNAGLDASSTFDLVAHTNNGEVLSLLSKYFVGYLSPKPRHLPQELYQLWEQWATYLRLAVETLTTFALDVKSIQDESSWMIDGKLDICMVRKFYQFQSRFLQSAIHNLFGSMFEKICLGLSNVASGRHVELTNLMCSVSQTLTAKTAIKAKDQVARIGEIICQGRAAAEERFGLVDYASKAVRLDMQFLEQIREAACLGMEAFEGSLAEDKQTSLGISSTLLPVLKRMEQGLGSLYNELIMLSVEAVESEGPKTIDCT